MFETDQQNELNLYLKDSINADTFSKQNKLWSNYETDYKPLVDFAKKQQIPFVATNVTQLYASLVYKRGFEAIENLVVDKQQFMVP